MLKAGYCQPLKKRQLVANSLLMFIPFADKLQKYDLLSLEMTE